MNRHSLRAQRPALLPTVLASLLLCAPVAGADGWVAGPPVMVPQAGSAITYDAARQRVLLVGFSTGPLDVFTYDGSAWSLAPQVSAVAVPGAVLADDSVRGRVVLFSGIAAATWEFNGSTWQPGPPTPYGLSPRSGVAMCFDSARGRTVLFGGSAGNHDLRQVWEYDGNAWTAAADPPPGVTARAHHAMAFDEARGRTVLFGGEGAVPLADTWEYDGTTWTAGPAAPAALLPRVYHGMAYDAARARIVLLGGYAGITNVYLNDTWLYDGTAWAAGPAAPAGLTPRAVYALAYDRSRDRVVSFGGLDQDRVLADTWELDGTTNTWVRGAAAYPGIEGRAWHAMAFDAVRGRAVLFGGYDGVGPRDDTWEFDGTAWYPGPPAPAALTPRYGATMTFDEARSRCVLVGGYDGASRADTWLYDGTSWVAGPAPPGGLVPRRFQAMAYDAARARSVVFGGTDGTTLLGDTWELGATGWVPGAAAPATLTPRAQAAMAFDRARARVVLFGGWDGTVAGSDTWEYDGTAWTRRATTGPQGRGQHAMALDALGQHVMMMGGIVGGNEDATTWEWDGEVWYQTVPPSTTVRRAGHGMVHDAARGRTLLFGGMVAAGSWSALYADTWSYVPAADVVVGPGPDAVNGSRVRAFSGYGLPCPTDFVAYSGAGYGANVGAGNVDTTPLDEILTGPGPSAAFGPHVKAFVPVGRGVPLSKVSFYAYGTLRYGVRADGGDLDGDGFAEIVTGAGPGDVFGPHVRAFDYDGSAVQAMPGVSFFAYGTPRFGVNARSGDVDDDGFDEVLTGPGPSPTFGPQVRGFDVDGGSAAAIGGLDFTAFPDPHYGARVGGGDVDGGADEVAVVPGPGPTLAGRLRAFGFDGTAVAPVPPFDVTLWSGYGGHVALADVGGDGRAELIAGSGAGSALDILELYQGALRVRSYTIAFPGAGGGVIVAGARLGY